MGSMSLVHWMIVIGVVLLLFGRNKISDLMGDVAQGIKSFKREFAEEKTPESKTNQSQLENPVGATNPVETRRTIEHDAWAEHE